MVRNFIAHAGEEFMKGVKGIACDMNADFAGAFKKAFPHLEIIYDRFHLIKNFNENVITPYMSDPVVKTTWGRFSGRL